jgi:alpha,alpha-trehalase
MQFFNPAIVPGLGIFQTQFNWDSLFASYGLMAQGKHEMVRGMADNLLYLLKTQGLVPNAARSIYMNKSQPPILPAMIRLCKDSVRSEHGDRACREWLKEAYRSLCDDYSRFWNEDGRRGVSEVDGEPVRLSRFYGENHDVAMDESGHDTSYRFKERALDVLPADLNSFLWRNAKDLAGIARDLADSAASTGDSREAQRLRGDAEKWEAEAARRKSDVLKLLWDDKGGLFRDYIFQGEGKGRICDVDCLAAAYAPLWVGMLDPSIPAERRMMDRLVENLPIFERRFGLAATGSDYGHPEMQWNSPSGWAPLHLMVVQGLVENGYYDDATRIAAKWLDLVALNDRTRGVILERYNVETGGLPPVQKGRYETTQGEGPGFGWTNSSFASMLVNVVGGIRVSSGAITLSPHVPPDTFGKDYEFSYKDIPEYGDWGVKFNYDGRSGAFRMRVAGSFTGRPPTLRIITPPLPPGSPPALTDESGKKIQAQMKEIPYKGNLVRYEVSLRNEEGRRELTLGTA